MSKTVPTLPRHFSGKNFQRMRIVTTATAELLEQAWTGRSPSKPNTAPPQKATGTRTRKGSTNVSVPAQTMRAAMRASQMQFIEKRMEKEIVALLQKQYGNRSVESQKNYVDVTVECRTQYAFLELKATDNARDAIRQALGQLLDYWLFLPRSKRLPQLHIVAQGQADNAVKKYVRLLRKTLGIPLHYTQYRLGSHAFELL